MDHAAAPILSIRPVPRLGVWCYIALARGFTNPSHDSVNAILMGQIIEHFPQTLELYWAARKEAYALFGRTLPATTGRECDGQNCARRQPFHNREKPANYACGRYSHAIVPTLKPYSYYVTPFRLAYTCRPCCIISHGGKADAVCCRWLPKKMNWEDSYCDKKFTFAFSYADRKKRRLNKQV